MTTITKVALAFLGASLLALAPASSAQQDEFVEVALNVEVGGETLAPTVLLKVGKTADIQFTHDPDYGARSDWPDGENDHAPVDEATERQDHRLLITVEQYGDEGYLAKTEYMNRPDGKWTSQWLPTMALRPDNEASIEMEGGEETLSKFALTLLRRADIGSFEDAKLAYFHTTGQNCHVPSALVAAPGTGNTSADSSGGGKAQPSQSAASSFALASSSDCCYLACKKGQTLKCCNACCSDEVNCPGSACCAGDHPSIGDTFGGGGP